MATFRLPSPRKTRRAALCVEVLEGRALPSANLFVATTGSDTSGTGTLVRPFATLNHALSIAQPGDTVTLRGGTYAGGRISTPNVTIQSYQGERARLVEPTNDENQTSVLYFDPDASHCTMRGLELVGGYYYAVFFQTTWDWGAGTPQYGAGHQLIENCIIHDTGRDCIKITPACDDITVRSCDIYNSGRRDPSNAEGIDDVNGDRLTVQDCHIHDIATNGLYAKGGAIGAVIERNLIENCGGGGIMVGFYTDADYFDTKVNPHYYENIGAIVRNNIILHTGYSGIGLYAALDPQVTNNTLIDVAREGQSAMQINTSEIYFGTNPDPLVVPCKDVTILNNIVSHSAATGFDTFRIRADALTGTLTIGNNRYQRVGGAALFEDDRTGLAFTGGLAGWKAHVNGDAGSTQGNPGLDAEFHLAAGSPCIDAGRTVVGLRDDYDGNPRGGAIDIGADEAGAGPALPTPPPAGVVGTGRTGVTGTLVQFSQAAYTTRENSHTAVITVTRAGDTRKAATVRYATANGTASAGSDYQAAAGTLNFPAGATHESFTITLYDDTIQEADETVLLTLTHPGGARLGTVHTATLTIADNDRPQVAFALTASAASESVARPRIAVKLSGPSAQTITVSYVVSGGSAIRGTDFKLANGTLTFKPGETTKDLPLTVVNDTAPESDETVQVTLSAPKNAALGKNKVHTFTIVDDDRANAVASTHIVFRLASGHVARIGAEPSARPEDLSAVLDRLSAGTDDSVNTSANGKWLVLDTTRFGIGAGWSGLARVAGDLSAGEAVRVRGEALHNEGSAAITSDGNVIVYCAGDGPHVRDLWATRRVHGAWTTPVLLTAQSPYAYNSQPTLSADGKRLLFDGGPQPYDSGSRAICEVSVTGTAFRQVVTAHNAPAGGDTRNGQLHHAAYALDGGIIFEAGWTGDQIWRLAPGAARAVRFSGANNEVSPVVLPDGRVVTLWLDRPGNRSSAHELTVRAADGRFLFTLLPGSDIQDIGLGGGV